MNDQQKQRSTKGNLYNWFGSRVWAVALGASLTLAVAGCQAPTNALATATPLAVTDTQPAEAQSADPATDAAAVSKLNLNTATGEEFLAAIPNLGNRMVREFEEYRPYVSIQQFRKEIGKYVDAAQVAEYEQYVYVPVDPNQADADTLQQLPGVDEAVAAELIAARPYADHAAFVAALGSHISVDELAQAEGYLTAE